MSEPMEGEVIDTRVSAADFDSPDPNSDKELTAAASAMASKAVAEVQGQMLLARQFPRDEAKGFARIMKACSRKSLAAKARYRLPRGGQDVTGPTIHLLKTLATQWGNVNAGVMELEQRNGESQMLAYAWDLQTNTRFDQVFIVPHTRRKGSGRKAQNIALDDPRDVYEATANVGSRRMRKALEGIIPPDVLEAAEQECLKTMRGDTKIPLSDRVRAMVAAFDRIGVPARILESYLKHSLDETAETELDALREIYLSVKDKEGDPKKFFESYARTREDESGIRGGAKAPAPEDAPPEEGADPVSEEKNDTRPKEAAKKSQRLPSKAEMVAQFRSIEPDIPGTLADTIQEQFQFSLAAFDQLSGSKMAEVLEFVRKELGV